MSDGRTVHVQRSSTDSPWTLRERIAMLVWEWVWFLACRWTPKPMNAWRLTVLRLFGCRVRGRPFVHQRARIAVPWRLTLEDRATIGDRANLYTLGRIEIGPRAIVAQETYLSTGTHDFSASHLPLVTAPIEIGADAFVGARALVLPGVRIGREAIVGAGSVVTRDLPEATTCAGNPCRPIRSSRTPTAGNESPRSRA